MPMSWLLAGQAIRVAQDLGLHVSNLLSHEMSLTLAIYRKVTHEFRREAAPIEMLVGGIRS